MTHYMHLKDAPFNSIAKGIKTVEMRLYDEKRREIRIGDTIEFERDGDIAQKLRVRVVNIHVFKDFKELYSTLPIKSLGYCENDVKSASYKDMEVYYSEEMQKKHGVCGIEFVLEDK